jgi:hypothetical protein
MTSADRLIARHGVFCLILCAGNLLLCSMVVSAQRQAADAAEISRDLLYLAPQRIQFAEAAAQRNPIFITRTGYAYQLAAGEIHPAASQSALTKEEFALKGKRAISVAGIEYTITPHSDDERATLSLSKGGETADLASAVLWTREQLTSTWLPFLQGRRKALTAAKLREDLEISDPFIYDIRVQGDSVWVSLGHSTGESELGIGSVVRFDLAGKRAKVYQPKELGTCEVTQVAIAADSSVWLASRQQYEGTILPCAGLLRLDAATGQAQTLAAPSTQLAGTSATGNVPVMITALAAADRLWVASDAGICSSAAGENWDCKRVAPSVSLKSDTPISNLPGDKPSGTLKPGDYEVRWANTGFLEVVTKDSFDAWIAVDDFQEAAAHNFDVEPYKLLNISGGGPAPIRLMRRLRCLPAGCTFARVSDGSNARTSK